MITVNKEENFILSNKYPLTIQEDYKKSYSDNEPVTIFWKSIYHRLQYLFVSNMQEEYILIEDDENEPPTAVDNQQPDADEDDPDYCDIEDADNYLFDDGTQNGQSNIMIGITNHTISDEMNDQIVNSIYDKERDNMIMKILYKVLMVKLDTHEFRDIIMEIRNMKILYDSDDILLGARNKGMNFLGKQIEIVANNIYKKYMDRFRKDEMKKIKNKLFKTVTKYLAMEAYMRNYDTNELPDENEAIQYLYHEIISRQGILPVQTLYEKRRIILAHKGWDINTLYDLYKNNGLSYAIMYEVENETGLDEFTLIHMFTRRSDWVNKNYSYVLGLNNIEMMTKIKLKMATEFFDKYVKYRFFKRYQEAMQYITVNMNHDDKEHFLNNFNDIYEKYDFSNFQFEEYDIYIYGNDQIDDKNRNDYFRNMIDYVMGFSRYGNNHISHEFNKKVKDYLTLSINGNNIEKVIKNCKYYSHDSIIWKPIDELLKKFKNNENDLKKALFNFNLCSYEIKDICNVKLELIKDSMGQKLVEVFESRNFKINDIIHIEDDKYGKQLINEFEILENSLLPKKEQKIYGLNLNRKDIFSDGLNYIDKNSDEAIKLFIGYDLIYKYIIKNNLDYKSLNQIPDTKILLMNEGFNYVKMKIFEKSLNRLTNFRHAISLFEDPNESYHHSTSYIHGNSYKALRIGVEIEIYKNKKVNDYIRNENLSYDEAEYKFYEDEILEKYQYLDIDIVKESYFAYEINYEIQSGEQIPYLYRKMLDRLMTIEPYTFNIIGVSTKISNKIKDRLYEILTEKYLFNVINIIECSGGYSIKLSDKDNFMLAKHNMETLALPELLNINNRECYMHTQHIINEGTLEQLTVTTNNYASFIWFLEENNIIYDKIKRSNDTNKILMYFSTLPEMIICLLLLEQHEKIIINVKYSGYNYLLTEKNSQYTNSIQTIIKNNKHVKFKRSFSSCQYKNTILLSDKYQKELTVDIEFYHIMHVMNLKDFINKYTDKSKLFMTNANIDNIQYNSKMEFIDLDLDKKVIFYVENGLNETEMNNLPYNVRSIGMNVMFNEQYKNERWSKIQKRVYSFYDNISNLGNNNMDMNNYEQNNIPISFSKNFISVMDDRNIITFGDNGDGLYDFLSNSYFSEMNINGVIYPTVSHFLKTQSMIDFVEKFARHDLPNLNNIITSMLYKKNIIVPYTQEDFINLDEYSSNIDDYIKTKKEVYLEKILKELIMDKFKHVDMFSILLKTKDKRINFELGCDNIIIDHVNIMIRIYDETINKYIEQYKKYEKYIDMTSFIVTEEIDNIRTKSMNLMIEFLFILAIIENTNRKSSKLELKDAEKVVNFSDMVAQKDYVEHDEDDTNYDDFMQDEDDEDDGKNIEHDDEQDDDDDEMKIQEINEDDSNINFNVTFDEDTGGMFIILSENEHITYDSFIFMMDNLMNGNHFKDIVVNNTPITQSFKEKFQQTMNGLAKDIKIKYSNDVPYFVWDYINKISLIFSRNQNDTRIFNQQYDEEKLENFNDIITNIVSYVLNVIRNKVLKILQNNIIFLEVYDIIAVAKIILGSLVYDFFRLEKILTDSYHNYLISPDIKFIVDSVFGNYRSTDENMHKLNLLVNVLKELNPNTSDNKLVQRIVYPRIIFLNGMIVDFCKTAPF